MHKTNMDVKEIGRQLSQPFLPDKSIARHAESEPSGQGHHRFRRTSLSQKSPNQF